MSTNDDYLAIYPQLCRLVLSHLCRLGLHGDVRADVAQNVLAWTYGLWCEHPDWPVLTLARRALHRRDVPYGSSPPPPRYQDALDYAEHLGSDVPNRPENRPDVTLPLIPRHLRALVEILKAGVRKREAARLLGVSPATVSRRCDELADILSEMPRHSRHEQPQLSR